MSDIISLANKIAEEKENIRQAIENRGVELPETAPLSEYAGKIAEIEAQVSEGDFYYRDTPFDDTATAFTVPGNYDEIDDGSFGGKTALESVNLNNVRKVGDGAFSGCTSLSNVVGNHVFKYENGVFGGCTSLTSFSESSSEIIGDNFLINCPVTSVTLNATRIGANVNPNNTALTTVSLPNCKELGAGAFYNCDHLDTLNLPNVEYVGTWSFGYMNNWNYSFDSSLIQVSLPKVKVIGANAFYGARGLSSVDMPLVERIEDEAFTYTGSNSGRIVDVNIPRCNYVGLGAFTTTYTTGTSTTQRQLNSLTVADGCEILDGGFYNMPYTVVGKIGSITSRTGYNSSLFYMGTTGKNYSFDFSGLHTVDSASMACSFFGCNSSGTMGTFFGGSIDLKNLTTIRAQSGSNTTSLFTNVYKGRGGITKVWINKDLVITNPTKCYVLSGLGNTTHIYTDADSKQSSWTNVGGSGTWHFNCTHKDFEDGIYNN